MKVSENPDLIKAEKKKGDNRLVLLALFPSVFAGLIHFGAGALTREFDTFF